MLEDTNLLDGAHFIFKYLRADVQVLDADVNFLHNLTFQFECVVVKAFSPSLVFGMHNALLKLLVLT